MGPKWKGEYMATLTTKQMVDTRSCGYCKHKFTLGHNLLCATCDDCTYDKFEPELKFQYTNDIIQTDINQMRIEHLEMEVQNWKLHAKQITIDYITLKDEYRTILNMVQQLRIEMEEKKKEAD